MELLKLLAIQSKIFEVKLLMKGREKRPEEVIFALNFKYIYIYIYIYIFRTKEI